MILSNVWNKKKAEEVCLLRAIAAFELGPASISFPVTAFQKKTIKLDPSRTISSFFIILFKNIFNFWL